MCCCGCLGGRKPMSNEQELTLADKSGLIFWVTSSSKRVSWLCYGVLFLLLPFLVALPTFFSGGHSPEAPDQALGLASFLVVFICAWMTLVDLLFRLPARTAAFVWSYLIGFGLTVVGAVSAYVVSLLLDNGITPTGHY